VHMSEAPSSELFPLPANCMYIICISLHQKSQYSLQTISLCMKILFSLQTLCIFFLLPFSRNLSLSLLPFSNKLPSFL
jgi:hypothetical protein